MTTASSKGRKHARYPGRGTLYNFKVDKYNQTKDPDAPGWTKTTAVRQHSSKKKG